MVDAVECAVAIQRAMWQRNLATRQPVEFRLGINLGDIVSEGTDIFGSGVNVAARLEALADPGGICISGKVHDELTGRIEFAADDMGEIRLKNIAGPVQVFRLRNGTSCRPPKTEIARLGDRRSIAVLAFVNLSADPDQEYFSDGITEDIIKDLSKIAGLMVVARNSSFAYKHRHVDVRTIGLELGVRSVLEG